MVKYKIIVFEFTVFQKQKKNIEAYYYFLIRMPNYSWAEKAVISEFSEKSRMSA